jgi:RHS repeat-associated protein
MLNAEDLKRSIDPFTGQVGFGMDLVNLPERNGLGIRLGVSYSSLVRNIATSWNQQGPTGVLGLGWSLGLDRITVVENESALRPDRDVYLKLGTLFSRLVRTGTAGDGSWTYGCENYVFWQIFYDPLRELWRIVDENAVTYIFGDAASGRNTVDWGVAWGGWAGPSGQTGGQRAVATAWSLSLVTNRFGDRVVYSYLQDTAAVGVGGTLYTQATYLSSIVGIGGTTVRLTYRPKDTVEYQDPHVDPPPPNAWQDRFETRYLARIDVAAPNGRPLDAVVFGYAPQFLGSGTLSKRLLASISLYSGNGLIVEPPVLFSYWGQSGGDGVSATQIFNAQNGAFYGAMKQATLAFGGTASYTYASNTPQYSARSLPVTSTGTATSPRLYFWDDYVLAMWLDGSTVRLQSYAWAGRWLKNDIASLTLPGGVAYAAVQIGYGRDCCALLAGKNLVVVGRDITNPGAWLAATPYTVALGTNEQGALAVGRDFACVLGLTGGSLYPYRLTGATWTADAAISVGAAGSGFAVAAKGALVVAVAAPVGGGLTPVTLLLRGTDGQWAQPTSARLDLGGLVGSASIAMGEGFAVASAVQAISGAQTVRYGALWWDATATNAQGEAWLTANIATSATPAQPAIAGATVALLGRLFRFDGLRWVKFDSSASSEPGATQLISTSVGADLYARLFATSSVQTQCADLLAYDPMAETWSVPAGMAITGATPLAAAAPFTDGSVGNYAAVGAKLWYRAADGTWSSVLNLPGGLSATDMATLCVIADTFVVVQQGTGVNPKTLAFLLANGSVVSTTPVTLDGQQFVPGTASLAALIGTRSFATYTGSYGVSGSTLTLYRPLVGNITGAQTTYVAATLTLDNGYGSITGSSTSVTAAVCNATGATIDETGNLPKFNQTTTVPGSSSIATTPNGTVVYGFYNGLTANETPAEPWPSAQYSNALSYAAVAEGLGYVRRSRDQAGTAVAQLATYWQVTAGTLGQAGRNAYSRDVRREDMTDGVTGVTTTTYRSDTGFPDETNVQTYNASGTIDIFTMQFQYWWQIYDTNRTTNLLSPVVQATQLSTPAGSAQATTGVAIQTWRSDWDAGAGRWAPDRSFLAISASSPAFNAWQPNDPAPAGYLLQQRVLSRTPAGLPIAIADALGRIGSMTYDTSQTYLVTSARSCPADPSMLTWFGCQSYESSGAWTCADPTRTIWSFITTADFHTGSQCIALPANTNAGPLLQIQPTDQTRSYVFSCWARAPSNFAPAEGIAQWTIQPYDPANGQAVGQPILMVLTPTSSGAPTAVANWNYFQATIDLPVLVASAGKALGLRISATNANTAQLCYVDELRLMPLDCGFLAQVYDLPRWRPQAAVDSNGQSDQVRYDPTSRPYVTLATYDRVGTLEARSYSRALTPAGTFLADFPNTRMQLTTSGGSRYYDFHDGNPSDWTFSDNDWAITGGELVYSGSGTGTIGATATLSRYAYTYFASSMQLASAPSGTTKISFGNGDVYMQWDQGALNWKLIRVSGTTVTLLQTNTSVPLGTQWVFAAIDGWVVCFANATQLFAYQYTMPSPIPPGYGSVRIATTSAASFDDVTVLESPQLRFSFLDGLGNPQQSLDFLGVQPSSGTPSPYPGLPTTLAQGVFLDDLGRPAAQRLSLQAPVMMAPPPSGSEENSWALVQGGEADYLRSPSGTQLTQQQYISGANGYTYASTTFEPSPLSRVTQVVPPRPTASDASLYAINASYGASANVGGGPVTSNGKYRIATATRVQGADGSGVKRNLIQRTTRDTLGRILMQQDGPSTGPLRQTGFGYDAAGRLSTVYRPNYYAPPGTSTQDAWKEVAGFDFIGQVVSYRATDTGLKQSMYDSVGRPRFVLDADGATLSPQRILYTKYDNLDRTTETGYIQDANYSWNAALQAKADIAAFPNIVAQPSGPNDATGAWRKRFTYDGNGNFDARFLVGRLVTASINQNGNPVTPDVETYSYDAYGNAVLKNVVMPNVSPPAGWSLVAAYNGQNRIASLTYPALDANAPSVVFGYDRDGRVAAIGTGAGEGPIIDPSNPPPPPEQRWSSYGYDMFGRLAAISYNNAIDPDDGAAVPRSYAYDAYQRLTAIGDPYFLEALSYENGTGLGGWSYYDGTIAGAASGYLPGTNWSPAIPSFVQQFQYDGYGRLTAEANSLSDAFAIAPGSATSYDANGNVVTSAQGRTGTVWSYKGTGANATNQVATVTSTVNASVAFNTVPSGATSANGWAWGSSNGGPSASGLVQTSQGPPDVTQVLKLAGGGLGHYEVLRLATYLQPNTTYMLTWQVKTDPGYGQVIGAAVWYVVLYAESGPSVALPLQPLAAATTWQTGQATFNPSTLAQTYGRNLPIVAATVELRNEGRNSDGSPGPAIYLAQAGAAGSVAGGAYDYDDDGSVIAAPGRGLTTLAYDPTTRLTTSIAMTGGSSLAFAYDADNLRSRSVLAGGTQSTTVTLTGMNGKVLATKTTGTGSSVNYYLNGPEGTFGKLTNGKLSIFLGDHLGSLRLAIDAASGVPSSAGDYMPFGGAQRRTAPTGTDFAYTDQRLDAATGLYNYNARLYDPTLGRFYGVDPARQYASPYTYIGNNPLNATDPTGEQAIAIRRLQFWALWFALFYSLPEFYEIFRGWAKSSAKTYEHADVATAGLLNKLAAIYYYPKKIISQVLANVSGQEVKVIWDHPYDWKYCPNWLVPNRLLGIPRFLATAWNVYRHIPKDVSLYHANAEQSNAVRHFSFMCRAVRTPGGGRSFALALGAAHEEGSSAQGWLGLLDGIADKLNNEIAAYRAEKFPDVDCIDLFKTAWDDNIMSYNGEGRGLPDNDLPEEVAQSFLRSIMYLWQNSLRMPDFTLAEEAVMKRVRAMNKDDEFDI